jgi:hypothetical protein
LKLSATGRACAPSALSRRTAEKAWAGAAGAGAAGAGGGGRAGAGATGAGAPAPKGTTMRSWEGRYSARTLIWCWISCGGGGFA